MPIVMNDYEILPIKIITALLVSATHIKICQKFDKSYKNPYYIENLKYFI